MKYCPQCHKEYTEVWITFCSDDGTILVDTGYSPSQQPPPAGGQRSPFAPPSSEPPPWRSPDPNSPGGWVSPSDRPPIISPSWQPPPPPSVYPRQHQSQGLAVASMILGLMGLFTGMFCLGPVPGIVALILGLIALSQIKKAPQQNGGKPFAIVGIVAGSLSVVVYGLFIIIAIISNILS